MPVVDALSTLFSDLLHPIQWLVAWVVVQVHALATALGLDPSGGAAWCLAIVGLVLVVRATLVPLAVAQVRAAHRMQTVQPALRKVRERYAGRTDAASRAALQREQAELLRSSGANPLGGCLPALVQAPVLYALFTTLRGLGDHVAVGPLGAGLVRQADAATLLGAPLSGVLWGSTHMPTTVVALVLVALMAATQLGTLRLATVKNTSPASLDAHPFARQQQTVLLYALPVLVAVPGLHVPIGVLLYWLTSTVWSLGQQLVVLRVLPNPGSVAERERTARRARRHGPGAGGR